MSAAPALFAPQRSGHLSVRFPTTVCSGTRWRRSHPLQTPGLQHHHVLPCLVYNLFHTVKIKINKLKVICAIQNFKTYITLLYITCNFLCVYSYNDLPCTVFTCRWPSLAKPKRSLLRLQIGGYHRCGTRQFPFSISPKADIVGLVRSTQNMAQVIAHFSTFQHVCCVRLCDSTQDQE